MKSKKIETISKELSKKYNKKPELIRNMLLIIMSQQITLLKMKVMLITLFQQKEKQLILIQTTHQR